jgi:HD-like signal output (HDOD) protein
MEAVDVREERIAKVIEAVDSSELSSIKSVVSGIVRLINDPRSTAKDLKEIIQLDPPLSAKILRISNSAYYSPHSKIDEIEKAVIWIGYNTVKELGLRQKTCEIFDNNEAVEGYRRSELWAYSVAVAMFSKLIYRRVYGLKGEAIYASGLLHKIGLIAEEQFLRKAFTKILQVCNQTGRHLLEIEDIVFGFTHADLGRHIAVHWGLPDDIVNAIGFHTDPYNAPEGHFKAVATLYVAAVSCHFAEIGYFKATPFNDILYQHCLKDLNVDQGVLNRIIDDGRYEIADMLDKGAF